MYSASTPLSVWLSWLETLSPKEINLGTSRVQIIMDSLQLPLPEKVILIAGTNGKGSSVAMTEALLRESGLNVGSYTSPHISKYNERIALNGKSVDDNKITFAFEKIEKVRGCVALTYFEYGTLAAFIIFANSRLDVWVLEVGLGGRLDATNIIDPSVALITNISLDHCAWLGDDIESIALEKAGVMRAGIPVIYGEKKVPNAIVQYSNQIGAKLALVDQDFKSSINPNGNWSWEGPNRKFKSLKPPGLLGKFQIQNASAVLAAIDAMGFLERLNVNLINSVLTSLKIPGRTQTLIVNEREWFFDVAHNPAASSALAMTLESHELKKRTIAIIGILDDKDVDGIIMPLIHLVDSWVVVSAKSKRAIPSANLAKIISNLTEKKCYIADSLGSSIEIAQQNALKNERILVTGSFFTVGPILNKLAI
jgi:dihydrofolate synthase/folylpolyglutamate synthase